MATAMVTDMAMATDIRTAMEMKVKHKIYSFEIS